MNLSLSFRERRSVRRGAIVLVASLCCLGTFSLRAADGVNPGVLQHAQRATDVTSGQVVGTGMYLARAPGRGKPGNCVAKISVRYDASKYLADLHYQVAPNALTREVFLFDGTALFVTQVSANIHPLGAETHVFAGPTWELSPFHLDVRRLGERALNFQKVLEVVPADKIVIVHKDGPEWDGRYPLDSNLQVLFTVSESVGLNVTKVVGRRANGTVIGEWTVGWKKISDRWIADRLTERRFIDSRETEFYDLHMDSLKLEPADKSEPLTLGALGMPLGSRILDHRPTFARKSRTHYYAGASSSDPAIVRSPHEELQELPTRRQ